MAEVRSIWHEFLLRKQGQGQHYMKGFVFSAWLAAETPLGEQAQSSHWAAGCGSHERFTTSLQGLGGDRKK